MAGRYDFYMYEVEEWITEAYGYSKDDPRYDECMKKASRYQKMAQMYNTKEYAALSIANETEFNNLKILDEALASDDWTREELESLLKIRESVEARWKKSCEAMRDYEKKVEG